MTTSELSPQDRFRSLHVTGRDRVRFLHNFCTADLRGLSSGQAAEAFFTDVRARIVAHGYVLMLDDELQIWLLADDPQRLRTHLDRYIITEDVTLTLPAADDSLVLCPAAGTSLPGLTALEARSCGVYSAGGASAAALCFVWNGQTLAGYCGSPAAIQTLRDDPALQSFAVPVGRLQNLRIAERFPIIGVDLTLDHLAPEADRNTTGISFQKGCYLGQEPIARIDALGHVNRALRCVRLSTANPSNAAADLSAAAVVQAELLLPDGSMAGVLTSAAADGSDAVGLAVVRLATASQISQARTAGGQLLSATVLAGP